MPLDLDFLSEIINVHWGGGGVYVTGSQWFFTNPTSDVWTNEIKSTEELTKWRKTISTPHGGGFMSSGQRGSAVGAFTGADKDKPMFVVGGLEDHIETGAPAAAMMMTSPNGVDWSPHTFVRFGQVYLLTWNEDKRAFYAGMWDYSQQIGNPEGLIFDVALRSVDGISWNEIGRTSTSSDDYVAPVEQYCSNKVTDVHGHKVPTSIFGYDEQNDILITPNPVSMIFSFSVPDDDIHGTQLKITRGPGNEHPGSATIALPAGMDQVWAVAYAAGIWQAAGVAGAHGVVATSIDDGNTWTITLKGVAGSAFANIAALDQTDSGNAGL